MSAPTIATTPTTNLCQYDMHLLPMVPVNFNPNDVKCDENDVPYIGCDNRVLVNFHAVNTLHTHYNFDEFGNEQLELEYSNLDLEDALDGLDLAMYAKYYKNKKELQANKDLLDHVTFLIKCGDMNSTDIQLTKESVHNKFKDGHNPFYKWIDLCIFPKDLMKEIKNKLIINNNICMHLHKKYRNKMWYISFQGTRFVMMSHLKDELEKCYNELKQELRYIASGKWMDEEQGTTERYERVKTRIDLELSNIDLIAETWGTTYEEADTILYKEAEYELRREQELCMFALTGENITVSTPIKFDELL
jgi:hypothetical protein